MPDTVSDTDAPVAGPTPVVGYTLVLPPGWDRIPLRGTGTDAAVRRILDKSFEHFGRDQVAQYRRDLEARLSETVAQARAKDGLDLYLPTELMHGLPVAASFLVSEGRFDTLEELDAEMMIAALAVRDGAEAGDPLTVDGGLAYRIERVVAPDPSRDVEHGSRRVEYTIGVPEDAKRWLVVAFSTLGAGDPEDDVAMLLVDLFDALMTTFRWRRG